VLCLRIVGASLCARRNCRVQIRAAKGIRKQREALEKRIASANAELKKVASALGSAKAALEASSTSASEARNVYKHCKQQYQLLVPTLSSQLIDVRMKATISTIIKPNLLPALRAVADSATTEQRQLEHALRNLHARAQLLLTFVREGSTDCDHPSSPTSREATAKGTRASEKEVHSVEIKTNQRPRS